MALRLLAKAVVESLSMPELSIATPQSTAMKAQFTSWADSIRSNHEFASNLVDLLLQQVFIKAQSQGQSLGAKEEAFWRHYHQLITSNSDLSSLWLDALNCPPQNRFFPLFMQVVTRWTTRAMMDAVAEHTQSSGQERGANHPLTTLEEQALRYVAGYVPMKLKQQYKKRSDLPLAFVECLDAMHTGEGDNETDDFLQYTKIWQQKVNRGGLFTVNNDTYLLFRAMEFSVRRTLNMQRIGAEPSLHIQEEMKHVVLNDPAVMAHWSIILGGIADMGSNDSDKLLKELASKWIAIHSHSFASGVLEQHQCTTRMNQRKSLRKGLKQTSKD